MIQTGDCAGLGEQPNAVARRLLSRVLWVGGLAVAGSVLGAASANAAEFSQADEPSGDLPGSLTSTVEPVTGAAGSLVTETETLLTGERTLTEDLQGDDAPAGGAEVAGLVERPVEELADSEEPTDSVAGLGESRQHASAAQERAADRDTAIETHTDRSMQRKPVDEAADSGDAAGPATGTGSERELVSLIGNVDRLLTTVDVVPDADAVVGELTGGVPTDVLEQAVPGDDSSGAPSSSTETNSDPLAVTGLVSMLDSSLVGGGSALEPVAPLLAPLGPVVHTTAPAVANVGLLADQKPRETARMASATLSTLAPAPNTFADGAPRISFDETGVARPADQDGESAVIHSSLDAGTDGQDPPSGTRGGLRPSLLVTPVAGLGALHVGAPGAATSADQAGPSSHALLPEEAVLRARLFSAAAYARNVEAKPLREANDPPVSPD